MLKFLSLYSFFLNTNEIIAIRNIALIIIPIETSKFSNLSDIDVKSSIKGLSIKYISRTFNFLM